MSVLKEIVINKRKEVDYLKQNNPISIIEKSEYFNREIISLKKSLIEKSGIITEFKRKSPSKPDINLDAEVLPISKGYELSNSSGISILTDSKYFGGSIEDIISVRNDINIPILRKDFIIDEWQIYESFNNEADCILLIVAALDDYKLKTFYKIAKKLGLSVITEVHDENELYKALKLNVECIGINNRNLKTLKIDLNTFKKLSPKIPDNIIKICESGISTNEEIKEYSNLGADAFLIGESLMKSNNIYKETRYLINK